MSGMEVVEADAWVWFKHPTEMWLPCKVTTGGRDVVMVDQSGTEYRAKAAECYPMHESSLNAVANMVELGDLNEASILHNLRYGRLDASANRQPTALAAGPHAATSGAQRGGARTLV